LFLPLWVASAQIGIGVSPAQLQLEATEFPVSATLFVKNTSETPQVIEVLLGIPLSQKVTLTPSKFAVAAGETARVLVEVEAPVQGKLAVVSVRQTPEGLSTGTGIEVPLNVSESRSFASWLRASMHDLPLPSLPIALGALMLFGLLRILLFILREEKRTGRVVRGVLVQGEAVSFE
ncbi:MAG: hypothetical protein U1C72_01540, partial [Candidatus Pacearchaeota archaeon]|nr:hypothetical protein [Candidatus Pacearchaeota archaeon]